MESVAFAAATAALIVATIIVFKTRNWLAFRQLTEAHRPRIKDFLLRRGLRGLGVRKLFPQTSEASIASSICCLCRYRLTRAWGLS